MAFRIYLEQVVGENCASIDDGDKVLQLVRPELVKGFQVEVDFKDVNLMLTPFLNACFGKLLEQFGREIVMTNISMRNISNELLQRINDFISRKDFFNNPKKLAADFDALDKYSLKNNSFLGWIQSVFWPDNTN